MKQKNLCRSVFKSGESISREDFTHAWVELISRLERENPIESEKDSDKSLSLSYNENGNSLFCLKGDKK